MLVNDLPFERNKNNLKTKNTFFPIFRVDHVRLSNEYFFASCALEQQYTYVGKILPKNCGKIQEEKYRKKKIAGKFFLKNSYWKYKSILVLFINDSNFPIFFFDFWNIFIGLQDL